MIILLKLVLVFAFVLTLIRLKVPLGVSLLLGSVAVALAFGMGPDRAARAAWTNVSAPDTLTFVALVGLVLILSLVLKEGRQIERITRSLQGLVPSRRFLVAALPAIVGLLPMPGGALFSAPMVEAACGEDGEPVARTCVNHWFRHVWEYTWPLYPGMILFADLLDMAVGRLCLTLWPLTVVAVLAGAILLLRKIPKGTAPRPTESRGRSGARFAFEMAPFLLVVGLHVATGLSLLIALGIGIALAAAVNLAGRTVGPAALFRAVFGTYKFYDFLVMAFGVKLFGGLLASSGALDGLGAFFASSGVPAAVVVLALPFVVGLVSGITIVYVSTAFPVLLALSAVSADPLPYLVLGFSAGFAGVLISPIHACLVLGAGYFRASLVRSAIALALPASVVVAASAGLFFLYRAWTPFP